MHLNNLYLQVRGGHAPLRLSLRPLNPPLCCEPSFYGTLSHPGRGLTPNPTPAPVPPCAPCVDAEPGEKGVLPARSGQAWGPAESHRAPSLPASDCRACFLLWAVSSPRGGNCASFTGAAPLPGTGEKPHERGVNKRTATPSLNWACSPPRMLPSCQSSS